MRKFYIPQLAHTAPLKSYAEILNSAISAYAPAPAAYGPTPRRPRRTPPPENFLRQDVKCA